MLGNVLPVPTHPEGLNFVWEIEEPERENPFIFANVGPYIWESLQSTGSCQNLLSRYWTIGANDGIAAFVESTFLSFIILSARNVVRCFRSTPVRSK
jgi:hypothetical protein